MAKARILKCFIAVCTLPLLLFSMLSRARVFEKINADLGLCLRTIDVYGDTAPAEVVKALVYAEDHRNGIHPGVDPIAIVRACMVLILRGRLEGASTIEQQFVRTITGRYERTIFRKLREQILAYNICRLKEKRSIASAYLAVAFYGYNLIGLKAMHDYFGEKLECISFDSALFFVSHLKYPCPVNPSADWKLKIENRVSYLQRRFRLNQNYGTELSS